MPSLWALLVAIDSYQDPKRNPASGALADSKNVYQYLREQGIPEDNIRRLHDDEATRVEIISTFREHLIDNPGITKGDAILFYYSGHGSFVKAPEGWTIVKGAEDEPDDMVEVILPYDENFTYPSHDHPTYAIPDRTLAALIDLAAARHGDNITVVLDCCCSGHGTRADKPLLFQGEVLVNRSIDSQYVAPLPHSLDHDLVLPISSRRDRRGRFRALGLNHVLLAACKSREQAQGTEGFGGFFTALWLAAMKDTAKVCPRTPAEVIKYINANLEELWNRDGIRWEQHPQCEGNVRDRIIFEETMIKADHFNATLSRPSSGEFEIEAGEIHGVKEGAGFEIYGFIESLRLGEKLGKAYAIGVGGRTSTVQADPDWRMQIPHITFIAYTATIIQKPSLRYAIHVDPSTSSHDVDFTRRRMSQALSEARDIGEAIDLDEADIEVHIGLGGDITLHPRDTIMGHLPNLPPRVGAPDLDPINLRTIFSGIARFNFHLALINRKHPFADKIKIEMLRFARLEDTSSNSEDGVFPLREVDGLAQIVDDNLGFQVTEEDEYAIVLRNNTDVDIYAQVWAFDPDEYSISPLYEPADDTQANLPRDGELQIGASTELSWPLTYYVVDGSTSTTLFVKVFLTDKPVNLRPMQQLALVGPDAVGDRGEQKGEIETRGLWDTILQPVTAVKAQD